MKPIPAKTHKPLYLNTGSTLLNLACSNKAFGGFLCGLYYYLVGDSSSGKTFLSLTCLAEAAHSRRFRNYRFIYDNSENGALMSVEKFFGKKLAERLEPPRKDKHGPLYSETLEDFYFNVDDAVKKAQPFIYILDSMDSLTTLQELDKFEDIKNARRKNKTTSGSFGDGKAKINSQYLRGLITPLRKSNSILIVIGQTRDNLGFGFKKKTRSGGNAPIFYACSIIWSSVLGNIQPTIKGKKRQIGVRVKLKVEKNRQTGAIRPVEVPIYHSYGIDDIGSCIDYLVDEGHWQKTKVGIHAAEFKVTYKRDKLIRYIEVKQLVRPLKIIVQQVWDEIEQACAVKRKKRYE